MRMLTLRNVDDGLARVLEERARKRHRSVEQEVLSIIRGAVGLVAMSPSERVGRAEAIVALADRPQTTDSLELLRDERAL